MLQLVRNNSPYTVLILFIFTLLVKMQVLIHPIAPVFLPQQVVYGSILHLLNLVLHGNRFAFTFLTVILLFGQSIYLMGITIRHRLFMRQTYIPAFAYISLTSLLPEFSYFGPPIIVNWLMLVALDIFLKFNQPQNPRKHIFNAGFIFSLAALVQFSAIGYFLFFISTLMILRSFNLGEWIVGILGYLTPIYFFAGLLYLLDRTAEFKVWPDIGISLPTQLAHPLYFIGCIIGGIILLSCGFYVLNDTRDKMAISVRRGWNVVLAYFVVSLIVCIFTPQKIGSAWLCALPPIALLASPPMHLEKNKRFSNFVFYFLIAFIIFSQFSIHK